MATEVSLFSAAESLDLVQLLLGQLTRGLAALDFYRCSMMFNRCNHLGIRERGDVAGACEVGDARDDTAHDLARTGLGHIGHDPHVLRPRDLADQLVDRRRDLVLDLLARLEPRFQSYVHFDGPAPQIIHHGYCGRLGDLLDGECCRLELLGAEPMPRYVDDVIDAS